MKIGKMSKAIASICVGFGLNGSLLAQDNTIKPFGPFTWDGGYWDAIEAAKDIDGVEKIEVIMDSYDKLSTDAGISQGDLEDLLTAKYVDDMLERRLDMARTSRSVCKVSESEELVYLTQGAKLKVSPVIISNVPFDVELTFKPSCGFLITSPDKVLKDDSGKLQFPYRLVSVELKSSSPLLADNVEEISKNLYDKYVKFKEGSTGTIYIEDNKKGIVASYITDQSKNRLAVDCHANTCSIGYNSSENKTWDDAYSKHMAAMQAKANSGKSDMSSGL